MAGAGTHLHLIIKRRFGEDLGVGCKCAMWIKKMDRNLRWAENHIPLIVTKMRNTAIDRGWNVATHVPGHRLVLREIVLTAIRRAKRDARRMSANAPGPAA